MDGRILLGLRATALHKTQSKASPVLSQTKHRTTPVPIALGAPKQRGISSNMSLVTAFLAGAAAPAAAPRTARPSAGFFGVGGGCALTVECSSRPQKKGTKHHMKTRPKKTQRWDIKRRPTQYPPLPALPEDWTLVAAGETEDAAAQDEESAPAVAVDVEVVAAPAAAD